jgi:hypothetical protein
MDDRPQAPAWNDHNCGQTGYRGTHSPRHRLDRLGMGTIVPKRDLSGPVNLNMIIATNCQTVTVGKRCPT